MSNNRIPQVFVFDNFSGSKTIDINQDGSLDKTHGEIVEGIIKAQTSSLEIKPDINEVDVASFDPEGGILPTLKELDEKQDLTGVYLNFSISGVSIESVKTKLLALADKGAKIFISGGNDTLNPVNETLYKNKNVFLVASSDGIIGDDEENDPTDLHVPTFDLDQEIANGTILFQDVGFTKGGDLIGYKGVDINADGGADFEIFTNLLDRFTRKNKTPKRIDEKNTELLVNYLNTESQKIKQDYTNFPGQSKTFEEYIQQNSFLISDLFALTSSFFPSELQNENFLISEDFSEITNYIDSSGLSEENKSDLLIMINALKETISKTTEVLNSPSRNYVYKGGKVSVDLQSVRNYFTYFDTFPNFYEQYGDNSDDVQLVITDRSGPATSWVSPNRLAEELKNDVQNNFSEEA